jgi:hypothetical protein
MRSIFIKKPKNWIARWGVKETKATRGGRELFCCFFGGKSHLVFFTKNSALRVNGVLEMKREHAIVFCTSALSPTLSKKCINGFRHFTMYNIWFNSLQMTGQRESKIKYSKCLVPICVFPEMKLRGLLISKTKL